MPSNAGKSKTGIVYLSIYAALLALLSACSPFDSRSDQIRVQSVHLIRTVASVPDHDKGAVMIAPVIQVNFSADIDLGELASDGWSISVATALCDKPDSLEWPLRVRNFGYVFDRFGTVNIYRPNHSRSSQLHESIQYHFYIAPVSLAGVDPVKYDLIHDAKDVCFQLIALKENIPIINETINRSSRSGVVMIRADLFRGASRDSDELLR